MFQGGIILLIFAVLIKMTYDSSFRHLAVEIGGPKRLYSLVTFFSAVFLAPGAIFAFAMGEVIFLMSPFKYFALKSNLDI